MTVVAVVVGLWFVLLICAMALIVWSTRDGQGTHGAVPDGVPPAHIPGRSPARKSPGAWSPDVSVAGGVALEPLVAVSTDAQAAEPSDERYFRAIASADEQLRTFERSQRAEARDSFLATMSALVRFGDAWMVRRLPSKGMPEDVRATLIRCVDARDEQLHAVVASNHAWETVARAASHAQAIPGVQDRDRRELGRLETLASRHVRDLADITRMPSRHQADVRTTD